LAAWATIRSAGIPAPRPTKSTQASPGRQHAGANWRTALVDVHVDLSLDTAGADQPDVRPRRQPRREVSPTSTLPP
jgi:hypothetical protein